jgi:hypothetical protein
MRHLTAVWSISQLFLCALIVCYLSVFRFTLPFVDGVRYSLRNVVGIHETMDISKVLVTHRLGKSLQKDVGSLAKTEYQFRDT